MSNMMISVGGAEGKKEKSGNRGRGRDVVVVGVKLSPSSREILTWTLAKFTNPGDQVVALHVALQQSPAAQPVRNKPNATNKEVDGIFDSVIGVYDGFCSIKQIDLQLKVTSGSSLRKALIEEAKRCNAIRLILGTTGTQLLINDSSFSLAKYCSKQLPSTCSVLVIQHGRVVYEKAGALTRLGDSLEGLKTASQQTMGSKATGQKVRKQKTNMSEKHKAHDCGDLEKTYCNWSSPNRSLGSPFCVPHPYKYVPPQVQGFRSCNLELEKLSSLSASGALREKHQMLVRNDWRKFKSLSQPGMDCLVQSSSTLTGPYGDFSVQEKPIQKSDLSECRLVSRESAKLGQKVLHKASSPCVRTQQFTKEGITQMYSESQRRSKDKCISSTTTSGWPLLHRSISMTKSENPSRARRMSVVEWALQLPDRPKQLLERHSGPVDKNLSFSSMIQKGGIHENVSSEEEEEQVVTDEERVSSTVSISSLTERVETTMLQRCSLVCKSKSCVVFQFAELQTATKNFSKDNIVGKGGCSQVYRGTLSDGRTVAVKSLNTSPASDSEQVFLTEIEIVSGLHHCHVVQLLGYCIDDDHQHFLLVYNFASEGNLEQKLHNGKGNAVLPWNIRYKVAVGVAEALEYLHGSLRPVVHRDVKSSNILLLSDLAPQLTDFGLSKWAPTTSAHITCNDVVGTFGYLAPEYFMYGKVNEKTDVYSFGVVLLELISGKHPIETVKPQRQENLVVWARPLLEDESSYGQVVDQRLEGEYNADQLKTMMIAASHCLRQSPYLRPRMSRILKLLKGEHVDLELRQDTVCKSADEGCVTPTYGDSDIRGHLTLALCGLDDDISSQADIDQSVDYTNSNKFIEEYLNQRYSRSSSFD